MGANSLNRYNARLEGGKDILLDSLLSFLSSRSVTRSCEAESVSLEIPIVTLLIYSCKWIHCHEL